MKLNRLSHDFQKQGTIHLPVECTDEFPKLHIQYLKITWVQSKKVNQKI